MQKSINVFGIFLCLISLLMFSCQPEEDVPGGGQADIKILQGDWIRVESNNPSADFIKVNVNGANGTITDKAQSPFGDGAVKWKGIAPSGEKSFAYEELGSDGNYYPSTITLITNDELSISVDNSGSGNAQKWVRDDGTLGPDGSGGPSTTQELECRISEETVLVNGPAAVDYRATCVVDITAKLTIEPGVVIEFEENAGLGIYDGGIIQAAGTAAEPIEFKGTTARSGWWRGIHIETKSSSNTLAHVKIAHAGANYVYCCNEVASVFLKEAEIVLDHLELSLGDGFGIYSRGDTELPAYNQVTITSHEEAPLYFPIETLGYLDGVKSTYTGNKDAYIRIYNSDVSQDTELPANEVPYLTDGEVIDIRAGQLTVNAGVEWVMKESAGLGVYDEGALTIQGTSANPVIIRGEEATPGFWRGIHIESNTSKNQISFARISEAGGNYVYCCNEASTIYLKDGGKLSIDNSVLSNGESYGMEIGPKADLTLFSQNQITTHQKPPLLIAAEAISALDGDKSSFSGNSRDFVEIREGSDVKNPTTFLPHDVPYLIGHVIDITESLQIDAGAELVFEEQGGLGVYDNGSLNAEGTASDKIIFRGRNNVQGFWRGIHVETNSTRNVIRHAELKNAGGNYVYCCNNPAGLYLKSGRFEVSNTAVQDNGGCGIFVKGGTLTESGNVFASNEAGHICN